MSGLQIIIDSRGGGGHIAAGKALKARWDKEKGHETRTLDFMGDDMINSLKLPFVGKMGDYSCERWNNAQMRGDINELKGVVGLQWLTDLIFYPIAVRKFTQYLRKLEKEPERVVSTQALCIDALARAILTVNKEKGWNMRLQVHMTDLPTDSATHFFHSLGNVGRHKELSKLVSLYTPCDPHCKPGETSEEFWKRMVGDVAVIRTNKLPIREAFFTHHCTIGQQADISVRVNHPHELDILRLGARRGEVPDRLPVDKKIHYHIRPEDRVTTLMLGSQPPDKAVNGYFDAFISSAKREEMAFRASMGLSEEDAIDGSLLPQYYFFAFCGKPEDPSKPDETNELLRKVERHLETYSKERGGVGLPPNIRIIPFTFQDDDTLAPMLHRSNVAITKSGGSTCFELMQLHNDPAHLDLPDDQKRTVFIHSEGLRPDGNSFTDFLWAVWCAIVKFVKWFFGVKDYTDPGDVYPDLLTREDMYEIQETCRMAAAAHNLSPSLYVDPLFRDGNLRRDPAPMTPFYAAFDEMERRNALRIDERYFTEQQRINTIANRTDELMEAALKKKRSSKDPFPRVEEMRKIAIQQLLVEQGIAVWEGGNANMLHETIGAKVVSPTYVNHFLPGTFFRTPEEIQKIGASLVEVHQEEADSITDEIGYELSSVDSRNG